MILLMTGRQEGHPACKKTVGVVICLERGADLHMAQLTPLPLTVSCFSKIQISFTFLVPAHLGSPGKRPLNGCVCVCVCVILLMIIVIILERLCSKLLLSVYVYLHIVAHLRSDFGRINKYQ